MKVFLSWSGSLSHKVASVLKEWLPSVIQSVEPYVSSQDIDKGARWSTDIAKELEASGFGILCVTKENVNAPWLNFEAGALGKSVDKSRVCPFLFDIKRSEVEGPILQFQSTIYEHEDVLKLVKTINKGCAENGIDEGRLEKTFKVWWPNLQRELGPLLTEPAHGAPHKTKEAGHIEKVLEEILELSRINQKLLRNPEELLPINYLRHIMDNRLSVEEFIDHPAFRQLIDEYYSFRREVSQRKEESVESISIEEVEAWLTHMEQPIRYIRNSVVHKRNRAVHSRLIKNDG